MSDSKRKQNFNFLVILLLGIGNVLYELDINGAKPYGETLEVRPREKIRVRDIFRFVIHLIQSGVSCAIAVVC